MEAVDPLVDTPFDSDAERRSKRHMRRSRRAEGETDAHALTVRVDDVYLLDQIQLQRAPSLSGDDRRMFYGAILQDAGALSCTVHALAEVDFGDMKFSTVDWLIAIDARSSTQDIDGCAHVHDAWRCCT